MRLLNANCPRVVTLVAATIVANWGAPADCRELFNGVDLDGWTVVGGEAAFSVENGEIVGRSTPGTPNTFLTTESRHSDFVLEVEFRIDDPAFNSGVQLRSDSYPNHNGGRLFGYQSEIDPSSRAWTGGLYFEGGSPDRPAGWLDDLGDNAAAREAFRLGEWNRMRVAAFGRSIQTWVNGVPAADYVDVSSSWLWEGVIALQVHSSQSETPLEVRWRSLTLEEADFQVEDLNGDGLIGIGDYFVLRDRLHTNLAGFGASAAYLHGDFNGDLRIDQSDFVHFREVYLATRAAVVVPEPATPLAVGWLAVLLCLPDSLRKTRRPLRRIPPC